MNRRRGLPSRKTNIAFSDLTTSLIEVNKKIGEKLKANGERLIKSLDNEDNILINKTETNENDDKNFKIEYCLDLAEEEQNTIKSKVSKKDKKITKNKKLEQDENDDNIVEDEEHYEFTQSRKKVCSGAGKNEENILNVNVNRTTRAASKANNKIVDTKDVNKYIKCKWIQIKNSTTATEFKSNDGIYLKLNNVEAEKFKVDTHSHEKENEKKINEQKIIASEAKFEEEKDVNINQFAPQEDDVEMDSDSDIEIPDIF